MSNDTETSRNSDPERRRRSRGGQKRHNNNNNESDRRSSDGRNSDSRQSGGIRREGGRTDGRQSSGSSSSSGSGKPQRRPMPSPTTLTWWQKVLKTIGLYKEPVRPPRPERRPDQTDSEKTREPRQPKTRDTRSQSNREGRDEREIRDERGGRDQRNQRDNRNDSNQDQDSPRRGKQRRERNERGPRGGDPSTVENRRVYVGNLSYDTTESDLEELFKGVGAVRRVEIVYNRSTHRSKGYGFIEMIDIDEAKRTVEVLHDQFFMGRQLTVSGAKSPDHEIAEKDEQDGTSDMNNNVMPPLAPIRPEVTNLIDESLTEIAPEHEIVAQTDHPEIPTEEFSPDADTSEEVKEQANS